MIKFGANLRRKRGNCYLSGKSHFSTMKFYYLFLLTLFSLSTSYAQNYYPKAQDHWTITRFEILNVFTEIAVTDTYRVENAVTFCEKSYYPLLRNGQPFCFFREEGTKLYGRKTNQCTETDIQIFDFNFRLYDTLILKAARFAGDIEKFAVVLRNVPADSSASGKREIIFQTLYQRMPDGYIKHSGPWGKWIAGIGSLEQTFYPFDEKYLANVAEIKGDHHFLTCFKDSLILKFTKTPGLLFPYKGDSCAYHYRLVVNYRPKIEKSIASFPNPATYLSTFNTLQPLSLQVLDLQGKIIRTLQNVSETYYPFEATDPSGIYLLLLRDENSVYHRKVWLQNGD